MDQGGVWVKRISQHVEASLDRGSPLGLNWYFPRYENRTAFPFADTTRLDDVQLSCGHCDSETNPCYHKGVCNENIGECLCENGASGTLCEITPLGNGICNVFFNTEEFGWDGGDCW